ncbi:hypothetical protein DFH05DRAFT_1234762 [Lentinula detonsa]|uniref:Uncharacterized protein n=1 Tax=Lentinula detonsa TaxID=2804962 RepID=A0A9W8NZF8_9AGAR|nr:hypothetical protein DFH05DRAFT_1234762 [Lentinula detonsa]
MSRTQHSSPKKNRLIGAIQAGKTIPQAAELTGIPHGSAKKIWAQYKKTGSTSNCRRSGRPKKIDERMGREIVREVQKNRRKPFQEIGNELEPKKDQKVKRKDWAEFVKGIDWSGVIWSDECYVYLGDKASRVFVTRREDEEYEEDCLIPTFKQSSIRVMIWACIMKGKKGPLVVLEYPGGKGGVLGNHEFRKGRNCIPAGWCTLSFRKINNNMARQPWH